MDLWFNAVALFDNVGRYFHRVIQIKQNILNSVTIRTKVKVRNTKIMTVKTFNIRTKFGVNLNKNSIRRQLAKITVASNYA